MTAENTQPQEADGLAFDCERLSPKQARVMARYGTALIHSHTFNLDSATGRLEFARRVAKKLRLDRDVEVEADAVEARLLAAAEQMGSVEEVDDTAGRPATYQIVDDDPDPERRGLYQVTPDGRFQLSNFAMFVDRDTAVHDDIKPFRQFEGRVVLHGESTDFAITDEDFGNNDRLKAAVYRAAGAKAAIHCKPDRLRTAVSCVSAPVRKTVTTNFGWTADGDAFLVPSGRIDAAGFHPAGADDPVRVDLGGEEVARWLDLKPLGPDELARTKRHLVDDFLHLHGRPVMHVLLGAAALAVLRRFAGAAQSPLLWLVGLTGSGKSFAAKLTQNFFGDFPLDGDGRFVTWISTANYIQRQGYFFRDAAYVVDDYKPETTRGTEAVKVMQAVADGAGRGRLRQDASTNTTRPIRGLLLSTGEDLPQHHASALARTIIVPVPQAAKDVDRGQRCLDECRRYSGVMADFIRHLIAEGRHRQFAGRVEHHRRTYYQQIAGRQNDARIAGNFALLAAAFEEVAGYLGDAWPDRQQEAERFVKDDLVALRDQILRTVEGQQADAIFLGTLRTLLEYRKVRVKGWPPNYDPDADKTAPVIGKFTATGATGVGQPHMPPDGVFAISTSLALEAVQKSLQAQGRPPLPATEKPLLAQLAAAGKLLDADGNALTPAGQCAKTFQTRLDGATQRCFRIRGEALFPDTPAPVTGDYTDPGGDGVEHVVDADAVQHVLDGDVVEHQQDVDGVQDGPNGGVDIPFDGPGAAPPGGEGCPLDGKADSFPTAPPAIGTTGQPTEAQECPPGDCATAPTDQGFDGAGGLAPDAGTDDLVNPMTLDATQGDGAGATTPHGCTHDEMIECKAPDVTAVTSRPDV